MAAILKDIVARNRAGQGCAIPSVCSAHPDVLEASLRLAAGLNQPVVIEATSNQVNHEGGYTGMVPADFVAFVNEFAGRVGMDTENIVFGGDHLGPQAWRSLPAAEAMAKAHDMVAAYVAAGFSKIHLDCSEPCADDPEVMTDALVSSRAAELAKTCLEASDTPDDLVFVIGTEVPPPGGARADEKGDIIPTSPEAAQVTLEAHKEAFEKLGLGDIWPQVVGLVVQPGVEFAAMHVHHLPTDAGVDFRPLLNRWPGLCLEAHSTDYQTPDTFVRLANMGFAFQKVGPALTFAYREAIYALDALCVLAGWKENLTVRPVMEGLMQATPKYWQVHYDGDEAELSLMRHYALADRIRYYWPDPTAQDAVAAVLSMAEGGHLPDVVLQQLFPVDVIETAHTLERFYDGSLPKALIAAHIQRALRPYFLDTSPDET